MIGVYPANPAARTRWILERRGRRNPLDPSRPYAFFAESEIDSFGRVVQVATIFLTNRECPWHCVMCDLWRNTTNSTVPPGAISGQVEFALSQLPRCSVLKLYNSGSFFDPAAVPRSDWREIARLCRGMDLVVVECHPRLVTARVLEFGDLLDTELEVAMGLETVHQLSLEALNKRFTLVDYQHAAAFLHQHQIAIRTFLLVHPPFLEAGSEFQWLERSIRFASDHHAGVVALIPLRHGNGAIDSLAPQPGLAELERAQEIGLGIGKARTFADTWDLARFARCPECASARAGRIGRINLSQRIEPRVRCCACAG